MDNFTGVKIALLCDKQILVYRRDRKPELQFAGLWDLPGGGRENSETPEECVVRELQEECVFTLRTDQIVFKKFLPALHDATLTSCFMVANVSKDDIASMQFGEEGSKWQLMPIATFLHDPQGVRPLQERLRQYLENSI